MHCNTVYNNSRANKALWMELKRWHLMVVYKATQDSMPECFLSAVPQIRRSICYSNKLLFIALVRIGIFEQNTPKICAASLCAAPPHSGQQPPWLRRCLGETALVMIQYCSETSTYWLLYKTVERPEHTGYDTVEQGSSTIFVQVPEFFSADTVRARCL